MLCGVTESMENRRRWNAYVCPACRLVFKHPDEHREQGVACPACKQVLQIPESNSAQSVYIPEKRNEPKREKKVRKRRRSNQGKGQISWEEEKSPKLVRKGKRKRNSLPLLVASIIIPIGLLAWLYAFTLRTEKQAQQTQQANATAAPSITTEINQATQPPAEKDKPEKSEEDFMSENSAVINEAEKLAEKFLAAKSVEEIRGLIRHPDITIPRIMKLYPDGKLNMGGLQTFNTMKQIRKSGNLISTIVRTNEFDERAMVFVITPEGTRIDWESWEGWCEMSWEEFMTTRPTKGTIFRVKLNHTNYYNIDFSDETKWKSYTLLSRDEKHRIYGYVEQNAGFPYNFGNEQESADQFLTLSLKFPANPKSNNQVIIERVVSNGWVTPDPASP